MPGLLVASWTGDLAQHVSPLFDRACSAYAELKRLSVADGVLGTTFRAVRLVAARSIGTEIVRFVHRPCHIAAAGWWFDPMAPTDQVSSLARVAETVANEGEGALGRLQGQYLVVTLDARAGTVTAAGDPPGMFPWYVAERDGVAWISTSSLALAAALSPRLDLQALRGLFMGASVNSPRSLFEGVRRAGIGERVVLAGGRVQRQQRWTPYRPVASYTRLGDAAEHGIDLLQRTTKRIAAYWPRVVSDLTSGLDSRLVVAALAGAGGRFGLAVNGPPESLDVRTCEQISQAFGWPLHRVELPDDWGARRHGYFSDGVALAEGELSGHIVDGTVYAKRSLCDSYDASVGGHLGELYRDFFWQQEFLRTGRTSRLEVARVLKYRFYFSSRPDMRLFQFDWREGYKSDQVSVAQQVADWAPDALNTAKLDAILLWKNSGHTGRWTSAMAPIIASPSPLATTELIEFAISVPWRFRTHGNLLREMIARLAPGLAAVPTWYGGSAFPVSLRRPGDYSRYVARAAKKLVRKVGQLTIRHPIFPDPNTRLSPRRWSVEFVDQLKKEGFLEVQNLRSAGLYHPPGLRQLLMDARQPDFSGFGALFTVASIELVCRFCDLHPAEPI